jgi:hypothetical protein
LVEVEVKEMDLLEREELLDFLMVEFVKPT